MHADSIFFRIARLKSFKNKAFAGNKYCLVHIFSYYLQGVSSQSVKKQTSYVYGKLNGFLGYFMALDVQNLVMFC